VWVPFVVAAAVCAWLFMDNLAIARTSVRAQAQILRRRHTWVMSWLYVGTFGSFIGYSAAFPLLITTQFHGVNPVQFAFLGPLVGSLARPLGGRLADRLGGSVVTLVNFVLMIAAATGVIVVLGHRTAPGAFPLFLASFMLLFITSGVGNGSTFRMIPAIFRADRLKAAEGQGAEALAAADLQGRREAAGVLAFSSALGAYGSFLIPQGFSLSLGHTGGLVTALYGFIAFYVTCVALTWWFYMRPIATSRPVMVPAETPALARLRV
jgi:NNP family nitrate/nitrite transporter-like MFS transporter